SAIPPAILRSCNPAILNSESFVPEPDSRDALFVHVLPIVLADVLLHLVIGHPPVGLRIDHGLLEYDRILDCDLVVKDVGCGEPDALSDTHPIAVRHAAIAADGLLDANGVNHQRVAVPASDGVAVVARLDLADLAGRLVQVDAADLAVRLADDRDLP